MKLLLQPDPADTWEQINAVIAEVEAAFKTTVVAEICTDGVELILPPTGGLVPYPEPVRDAQPAPRGLAEHAKTAQADPPPDQTTPAMVACPDCGKYMKPNGMAIHRARAHRTIPATKTLLPRAPSRAAGSKVPCPKCGLGVHPNNIKRHAATTCKPVPLADAPPPPMPDMGPIGHLPVNHDAARQAAAQGL